MPYYHKKVGDKQCVYKKDGGAKVGCTKGSVKKYLAALHANANESIDLTEENTLKGGKSDNLSLQDIANKFKVNIKQIKYQIQKGINVEMEHTNDKEKATEIATDHVSEFPDYYDRLEKMEKKASKEWKTSDITENTKSLIKRLIRENLGEIEFDENYFIRRIPFLKDYKFFKRKNGIEAQRVVFHENVEKIYNNDIFSFPQFNVSSEFVYDKQIINDSVFHNFIIKNSFHIMKPTNMSDIEYKIVIMVLKQISDKLSFSREIHLNINERINEKELNIINEMNKTLFDIEEYTNENNTSLF